MTKRKQNPWQVLLLVTLVVAIFATAIFLIWHYLGDDIKQAFAGTKDKETSFTVTINGTSYNKDASGLVFASGVTFTVEDADDYTFAIFRTDADVTVDVDGEAENWSKLKKTDFTSGFGAIPAGNGYMLIFPSLEELVANVIGAESVIIDPSEEDLFTLTVYSGKESLSLGFTLTEMTITVDKPNIVW